MPALIGYMLTIVVMLGGYLIGLQWLVSPPDPWKSAPQTQQVVAKKRPPTPVQAAPAFELSKAEASGGHQVTAETGPVASEPAPVKSAEEVASHSAQAAHHDQAVVQTATLTTEPAAPSVHPAVPPTTKSVIRKRAEKKQRPRLKLMVLRTYERSDGTRFSRLLPVSSSARLASYQDGEW